MAITMYSGAVPTFVQLLGGLKIVLQKAEEHVTAQKWDPAYILNLRLYPDMFTLERQVRQGVLTEVHLNLAGIQGTGQTGNLYIGTGAQKFSNIGQPVGPGDTSLELNPIFTLEHTDGCAADQPQVNVTLNFGPGGELLARSFISAGWNNGPALIGLAPDAALPAGGLRALAVELPR